MRAPFFVTDLSVKNRQKPSKTARRTKIRGKISSTFYKNEKLSENLLCISLDSCIVLTVLSD